MKTKIIFAVAVLLVVGAQIHYTLSRKEKPAEETSRSVVVVPETAETPEQPPASSPEQTTATAAEPVPIPEPEQVNGIRISGAGGEAVELRADKGGWTIASLDSAPADPEKISRFLASLLRGVRQPLPLNADPSITGIGDGEDITVLLELADGGAFQVRVGRRPEGDFQAVFAAFGDAGTPVVLGEDIRGALGLWRNAPAQTPDAGPWLLTRVLRFNPDDVAAVSARYPDHEIAFARAPGGGWTNKSHAPGGEWDNGAVDRWLADLSAFTVTGLADPGDPDSAGGGRAVELSLSLTDGTVKRLSVERGLNGEGMNTILDDHPGWRFMLPDWRFEKYFLRLNSLFPKAVPHFQLADIRLLDIRRGGDSAKIARRDGEWHLVGMPYALRPERVERLARLVAGLTPDDYADPEEKAPRTTAGGPVLEIILADGTMRQYRLGGRHPLFQRRYVTVDNTGVLSLSDPEAGVLFPGFEELLDLGPVFPGLDGTSLARVELIRIDDGTRLVSIRREGETWTAENEHVSVILSPEEEAGLTAGLLDWRVAGLYEADSSPGKAAEGMMRLRVADASGTERGITLLSPQGRDIPYLADGDRAFLLDRLDFFGWLGAVRSLSRRIDAEAAARTAREETALEGEALRPPEPQSGPLAEDEPAAAEEKEIPAVEPESGELIGPDADGEES